VCLYLCPPGAAWRSKKWTKALKTPCPTPHSQGACSYGEYVTPPTMIQCDTVQYNIVMKRFMFCHVMYCHVLLYHSSFIRTSNMYISMCVRTYAGCWYVLWVCCSVKRTLRDCYWRMLEMISKKVRSKILYS
jgi:hypothetical protein